MPSNKVAPPPAASLNLLAFEQILSLYDKIVDSVYQTKVKDEKKRKIAIETDDWRFDTLPDEVSQWKGKDDGLNLQQLQRLVEWKITHGKYRPFLPGQIRKNTPAVVPEVTSAARQILLSTRTALDESTLKQSLDKACTLAGVGPATGTLLLSIFNPKEVPFFQDELFAWITASANHNADVKLKYNVKEYSMLLEQVNKFRARLGEEHVHAWQVEKVGYVVGHWDLVSEDDATKVFELLDDDSAPVNEPEVAIHSTTTPEVADGLKRKRQEEKRVQSVQGRNDSAQVEDGSEKRQKTRKTLVNPGFQSKSGITRKSQRTRKQRN